MLNRIVLFLLICLVSCRSGNEKTSETGPQPAISMDSLIEMNRNILERDILRIEQYIDSTGQEMIKTPTGMFIGFVNKRGGETAKTGDKVVYTYKIRSLNGNLLYSSDDLGLRDFLVDQTRIESGWNEASKLMGIADSAVAIFPPHLAFGRIGDGNRVGQGAILIYELRLDSIVKTD